MVIFMRTFLVVFSLLAITIFVFHFHATVYEATTAPWTRFLAFISAELAQLFDDRVWSDGVEILTDPATNKENFAGVRIVAGCNGIEAWLVLVAAIMAFPPYSYLKFRWVALGMAIIILFPIYWDEWLWKLLTAMLFLFIVQIYSPIGRQKLLGVLLGFVAVQSVNIVRVISLFYLGQWNKDVFDFAHYYLWQALIILDAFVVFLVWLSKLPNQENDARERDARERDVQENGCGGAFPVEYKRGV